VDEGAFTGVRVVELAQWVFVPVAGALLADWGRWAEQFSVIMPRDYRRAVEARRTAEAEGTDVDRAVMEAARG
jgi:glutamate synthase (NADPH/NADH) large chain